MRRIAILFVLLALLAGLAFSAEAASAATRIQVGGTASSSGMAQMTMTATIHLDQPVEELLFPLPGTATNITMNGSRASSYVRDGVRYVNLTKIIGQTSGDFTFVFNYLLEDVIVINEAGLTELQIPLLAGFAYPVNGLEFSLTLPGPVDAKPAFSSGYHQANIEKDLTYTMSGATITGRAQTELKDHETLIMTLPVSEEMFPQKRIDPPDLNTVNTLVLVFSLAALVYWLIFLRNLPLWPASRPTPPEGYSAGQLRGVLHLQGADLSMMVFSWAQLGYLQICMTRPGKVTLHKQMDMGNERSNFEQKCFRLLFHKHSTVDTTGAHYAAQCQKIEKMTPNVQPYVHPRSGNPYVFRGLAALAGLFSGIQLSIALSADAAVQWLPAIILSIFCGCGSWCIHRWAAALLSPEKRSVWLALALAAFWLILSAMANRFSAGLWAVLGQFLAGLMAAFGGRRTYEGRQAMAQTLGLRRYLSSCTREQIGYICRTNPDYFHQMAPYALALGVDKRFARSFKSIPVSPCPYIQTGSNTPMRAEQMRKQMQDVLRTMTARQQRSGLEKIAKLIGSFGK
ncbi:MAG: DUF2207 domain-containing protein [Oscillospiraceae bacterium]|nr:DUF2207 domain-containing protein [Oscillospiraceae bacterium]